MKRETPRDEEGRALCEFCLEERVPESLGTKPRRYCCRSHRQRAYEMRKQGAVIRHAVATAVELDRRTSRDAAPTSRDNASATSRDDAKPEVEPQKRTEPPRPRPRMEMGPDPLFKMPEA